LACSDFVKADGPEHLTESEFATVGRYVVMGPAAVSKSVFQTLMV
jgi:hypothetical protein